MASPPTFFSLPHWQSGAASSLPAAQSLPDALARAIQNKQPLIVMVSLEGCVFCRQARQSHLSPMHKAGTVIVQVDMRSSQPVLDFAGKLTTHDQLTRQWKVSITPTLLFLFA
jgi:thioredoxin-related protein